MTDAYLRDRPSGIAVAVLYAFSGAALAGYATFGLHPSWLAAIGDWARLYGFAFEFFARAQVWLAGAVLALVLYRRVRFAWLSAFAVLYGISLGSELAGTTWGIPFGAYGYTYLLGVQWLERVPVIIPLSWFTMAVPSYALARHRFGGARWPAAVLLGSFVLLVWDLSLDPAMSHATRYWWWGESGAYYGMPLLNLFGWYVTGLALMFALHALRADRWLARVPVRLLAAYYGANLLLPLGMCMAAGLWGAVLLSAGTLVLVVLVLFPARFALRERRLAEVRS